MPKTTGAANKSNPLCPLCRKHADAFRDDQRNQYMEIKCKRCGRVRVAASAVYEASNEGKLHLLSSFFRRLPLTADPPIAGLENWRAIVRDVPEYSPLEKVDRLLAVMASKTVKLGWPSNFDPELDFPLLSATDSSEVLFLTKELAREGLLSREAPPIVLSLKGWQRFQESQKTGKDSNRAFVAMWFSPQMNNIYANGISPAIVEAGYVPLRIDLEEHVNRIDDEIIAGLRASRFAVADFTGQRGGVYFEAGFMQGLGRNVFWTCSKDELADVHFDIKHFNFIDYETPQELLTRLRNRIQSVEGQGPSSVR